MRTMTLLLAALTPFTAAASDLSAQTYQVKPTHNALVSFKGTWGPALTVAWTAKLDGQASFPLTDGTNVYALVAGSSYGIVAVTAKAGKPVWKTKLSLEPTGLAYDKGELFTVTTNGAATAFSPKTGKMLWTTTLSGSVMFVAAPTAYNGIVLVEGSGFQGLLYALDETSGRLLWTQTLAEGGGVPPTVTENGVYAASSCDAYDFTPSTGAPVWHYQGGCSGAYAETVLFGGAAYVRGGSAPNIVLNAMTGTPSGTFAATATPAIHGEVGYFLNNGTIAAVAVKTGKTLWQYAGDGSLALPAIAVNNDLVTASGSGMLTVIDAKTGQAAWTAPLGQPPQAALGAGARMIFVPLQNRTLVAYGSET